jgi:hypothetical protein
MCSVLAVVTSCEIAAHSERAKTRGFCQSLLEKAESAISPWGCLCVCFVVVGLFVLPLYHNVDESCSSLSECGRPSHFSHIAPLSPPPPLLSITPHRSALLCAHSTLLMWPQQQERRRLLMRLVSMQRSPVMEWWGHACGASSAFLCSGP